MKQIEIILRRFLIRILLLFSSRKTESKLPHYGPDSKILFIRLNRIGDALVTTPLLHQIKKNTGCSIYVLANKKNHFVFNNCPDVDKVIVYEKNDGIRRLNEFIKKNNIETIVDLHDDVSTTVSFIVRFINTKYKFGLKKFNEKLYTNTVERPDATKHHVIERILEFAQLFGFQPNCSDAKISYKIKDTSSEFAEKQLKNFKDKFLLGINITAGSDARFWGIDNFKQLVKLISGYNVNFVLFTTENKFTEARRITNENLIYPVSKDFDIFAAGISKLDMLFTPDTSVVHIASMFKIPVFGIYVHFNTDEMVWTPYNTDFESVITKEPNLKNVTFEEVKMKFIPFFEKHFNAQRNSGL
jgi:ADP-heptose:LPS heptosyltransferase